MYKISYAAGDAATVPSLPPLPHGKVQIKHERRTHLIADPDGAQGAQQGKVNKTLQ